MGTIESVVAAMQARLDALTPEQEHLREFLGTYQRTTLAVGKAVARRGLRGPRVGRAVGRRVRRAVRRRARRPPRRRHTVATLAARVRRPSRPAGAAAGPARHQRARELRPPAGAARGDHRRRLRRPRADGPPPPRPRADRRGAGRPGGGRGRRAGRPRSARSLLDRALQPLNRVASKRFLREARLKVWHNTTELQVARLAGPTAYDARLARAGGAQRRAHRRPARPRPGAAPAGGRRLRRRPAAGRVTRRGALCHTSARTDATRPQLVAHPEVGRPGQHQQDADQQRPGQGPAREHLVACPDGGDQDQHQHHDLDLEHQPQRASIARPSTPRRPRRRGRTPPRRPGRSVVSTATARRR